MATFMLVLMLVIATSLLLATIEMLSARQAPARLGASVLPRRRSPVGMPRPRWERLQASGPPAALARYRHVAVGNIASRPGRFAGIESALQRQVSRA